MKIYFKDEKTACVADVGQEGIEPQHIAAFELKDGQSTFVPRYALEGGKLVDKFSGKTDEEVAVALQEAEAQKAAALAAEHAA